jgi:hypothetical protein
MSRTAVCQRKTEPTASGPSACAPSTSGCQEGHSATSVWISQMVSMGAWIRISSRVMTGAAVLMSIDSSFEMRSLPPFSISPPDYSRANLLADPLLPRRLTAHELAIRSGRAPDRAFD